MSEIVRRARACVGRVANEPRRVELSPKRYTTPADGRRRAMVDAPSLAMADSSSLFRLHNIVPSPCTLYAVCAALCNSQPWGHSGLPKERPSDSAIRRRE